MDIAGGTIGDWLVIGWFTPDYRAVAEKFAVNLAEHGAPYHLFARPKNGGWDSRPKPCVVLEAMDAHPGKTLVLMDVDCTVRGDIAPALEKPGDVILWRRARDDKSGDVLVFAGSRVIAFRPTDSARRFALEWQRMCALPSYKNDELSLTWTYLSLPEVACSDLGRRYSGRDIDGNTDGCVIVHSSASYTPPPQVAAMQTVRRYLKMLERPFRTGRTRRRRPAQIG